MLNRLEMIIQKTSALSMELQDIIAEQWLYDLDNEISWQKTLQQPQDQLSMLALEALRQSAEGKTVVKGFDEI